MTKKAYIIHGWDGSPNQKLFVWLKTELEKRGFQVFVPSMPNTATPEIHAWVSTLQHLITEINSDTVIIGHSIGGQAVLRYLETLPEEAKAGKVIFIASWTHLTPEAAPDADSEAIVQPWLETPIDWKKIKTRSNTFTAFFSDNDPYVSLSEKDVFEVGLGAKIVVEKNKGHFTDEDGVFELPSVLDAVN